MRGLPPKGRESASKCGALTEMPRASAEREGESNGIRSYLIRCRLARNWGGGRLLDLLGVGLRGLTELGGMIHGGEDQEVGCGVEEAVGGE